MKKLLVVTAIILLAAVFLTPPIQAQVKFGAGAAFGFNFATQTSDQPNFDDNKKGRTGIVFGGIFSIAFTDFIGLQPEVRISGKGAKWEASQGSAFAKWNDKYSYLEIPVFLRGSIPTGTLFTPDLFLGPILGIKLSAKEDLRSNVYTPYSNQTLKTKSIDFGLGFGAGGRFTLGPGDAFINFMYNLGLSNVNDDPAMQYNIKNRCLTIATGYIFRFRQE